MALIIEDGTIVVDANSFTTDTELVAFAEARGKELPATESERDQLQILAVDYLTSSEPKMKGSRVSKDQELCYPRSGVTINGFAVASDEIPKNLKNAQMELAILANSSGLFIDGSSQNIQREKVDVLEVSYFSGGSWSTVRTDSADTYLKPLLKLGGSSAIMVRI